MEDAYIVKGGQPLKGEVQLSGAKNIALKVIIAALMFDGPVTIKNIPHIRDIEELIHLITILGGKASFVEKNKVIIDGSNITSNRIDLLHASKVRVSFMFFAPLLKKFRQVLIPNPGGCRIGARDIDRPISVLRHMGVDVSYNSEDGYYTAKLKSETLNGTTYRFDKPSHTGTEFAIMLASLAEGITVLENPSSEPEIDDLIEFLNNSGAKITKKNSSIIIEGVNTLKSDTTYTIQNDRNEAVTYACLGIATRGDVTIKGIQVKDIEIFIDKVKESGGNVEIGDNCIRFFYMKPINATEITVLPHPGFMTDWQGPWAVLMTQAEGTSIIHETVYENRFA
ncbi:MAG TPA: UDP-N-acetylglucosamine 1-carboxyvinyltransferase, partial [Candidatus Nitrosocosmicus sp.]|nr:UDP-N-acetylglucosamine 1-carboxyvinyltransferase [Candidatus Nitrosocosmicus sp.]